jgi:hypothetical protein
MRVNQGQELVIAGYTPSDKNFDALVIGYYDGPNLIYAARTRNGLPFSPACHASAVNSGRYTECVNGRGVKPSFFHNPLETGGS